MLPAPLYLDTARLGTMSPGAQRLHNQFVRLAAEQPSSLYVEEFLRDGFSAWPDAYQSRYAGLAEWTGVAGLQNELAQTVSSTTPGRVILATRSTALMKLAARQFCERCRNVLTTDLSWQPYQQLLQRTAKRTGTTRVTAIPVRRNVLRDRIPPNELTEQIVQAYARSGCDGLFLPIVDNFGIRLPVARIAVAIRQHAQLRFVVADAAQAIGHVPLDEDAAACDMLIAGVHKWLHAYLPLGVAWLNACRCSDGTRNGEQYVNSNDPLFQFAEQLAGDSLRRHSETVNLAPLFASRGALSDLELETFSDSFDRQMANVDCIAGIARRAGWSRIRPHRSHCTGILLLRHPDNLPADALRQLFLDNGVIATAFDGGLARISLPRRPLLGAEKAQLRCALELTVMRRGQSEVMRERQNVVQSP